MRIEPRSPGQGIAVAYLCHLLVPLLIALDEFELQFVENTQLTGANKAVLFGCGLWLVAGIGVFHLIRDRARFARLVQGPLLSFYTVLLMLVLGEAVARLAVNSAPAAPTLRAPNSQIQYEPASWGVTGVTGVKRFTTNSLGLRGPELPKDQNHYKIIAVGGSTTECFVLDDSEEWPHILMEKLSDAPKRRPVWLANAGVAGHNTVHHLAVLQTLPIFDRTEMLIFLIGLNDLLATVAFEGGPTQATLEQDAESLRETMLGSAQESYSLPHYTRLRLYDVTRRALLALSLKLKRTAISVRHDDLKLIQKQRAEGTIVPLPVLQVGLEEYRARVERLVQQCQALRTRCLFLTQPTLWRDDLTPLEQSSLTDGYVGRFNAKVSRKGYVSAADLELAMNAYNRTLLDMCREKGLECFDLAAVVPKNNLVFYDDSHYTEAGARLIAERLAEYLVSRPPFDH
jgi:GDSL-like Lipase/Acylhydrolase family